MIAENSISVFTNMLEDIKKICFRTLFVVQVIFMVLYSYSIYANLDRLIFLITYSILFALSIFSFGLFLVKHKKNKKQNKEVIRAKNFLKYIVNAIMLVVNIVEMVKFGINDFSKMLLVISGVSLLVQVIFEFVKMFAEKYVRDLTLAVKKDFKYLNPGSWGAGIMKAIDAPLEALALRKEGKTKELSKEELILKEHRDKHEKRVEEHKEEKELAKIEKKAESKKQRDIALKKEMFEFKKHIATILKKKKED